MTTMIARVIVSIFVSLFGAKVAVGVGVGIPTTEQPQEKKLATNIKAATGQTQTHAKLSKGGIDVKVATAAMPDQTGLSHVAAATPIFTFV